MDITQRSHNTRFVCSTDVLMDGLTGWDGMDGSQDN